MYLTRFTSGRLVIRSLGHLAIWPVFYTVGVLVLAMDLLAARTVDWRACLFVGLCAHGCYLLDRIKASDARLDPADAIAQPERYGFLRTRSMGLRSLIVLDLLIASVLAFLIWEPLVPVPLIGAVCVHLYAGRPASAERPRLKDLPAVKGIMIAVAHTALAAATVIGITDSMRTFSEPTTLLSLAIVCLIVFADAVLCDLDDHDADRAFSTMSMPVLMGTSPAWILAFSVHLIAGIVLIIHDHGSVGSILFACGVVAADALLTRVERQRDWVDARLLPLAILLIAFR